MGKRGNGEGSVYKRKDGRWVGQYLVYTVNGPKYRYPYGKTRAAVAERLAKALSDRDGGLNFDAGKLIVSEYMPRWLSDSVRDTMRRGTYVRYEQITRRHIVPALGRTKLKNLTPAQVHGLYRQKLGEGLSPARSSTSTRPSTKPSSRPLRTA